MKVKFFGTLLFFSLLLLALTNISEAAELAVKSCEVSIRENNTAKENWEKFLYNYLVDSDKCLDEFYLGEGFIVETTNQSRIAIFPIVEKETKIITFALQVADNSILLSKQLGEELNKASESAKHPIVVISDEQSYFYRERNEITRLIGEDEIHSQLMKDEEITYEIDITSVLEEPNEIQSKSMIDHVLLPWTVYDIQTTMPWCEYYSINTIVNNLAGKEIMNTSQYIRAVHPDATDEELASESWIIKQTILDQHDFLAKHYNMSIRYDTTMFKSFEKIKNELKNRKAAFVVDMNNFEGTSEGHAIVQIGYTASDNSADTPYYYYWNPWWKDTFVVSSTAPYIQLGTYKYTPFRAQYNFAKPVFSFTASY